MELIDALGKLKGLINTSLFYSSDVYDIERLNEMKSIVMELTETYCTNLSHEEIELYFQSDVGYVTPKVDIRSAVFNDKGELLLVKEKIDGSWSLPGGWADIGYSPSEIAKKETFEEAGILVEPVKLIKIVDKAKHRYPKSLDYVYKLFFYCLALTTEVKPGLETSETRFFSKNEIIDLNNISVARNSLEDLLEMFEFNINSQRDVKLD